MKINAGKLTAELRAAGIKVSGCNSAGVVWAEDGVTEIQGRKDVKAVLKAHDPTEPAPPTKAEKRAELKALFAKQKAGTMTASEEERLLDIVLGA